MAPLFRYACALGASWLSIRNLEDLEKCRADKHEMETFGCVLAGDWPKAKDLELFVRVRELIAGEEQHLCWRIWGTRAISRDEDAIAVSKTPQGAQ